jgi:hypothetical protein
MYLSASPDFNLFTTSGSNPIISLSPAFLNLVNSDVKAFLINSFFLSIV